MSTRLFRLVFAVLALLIAATAPAQETPEILWSVQAHGQSASSVSFAGNGQVLATAADADESTAKLWSAADGSLLASRSLAPANLKQVTVAPGVAPGWAKITTPCGWMT